MRFSPKVLTTVVALAALLAGCSPVAESQTLRERLRDRAGPANASLPANTRQVTLQVAGRERSFYLHEPPNRAANAPVLIALHGGGGGAGRFLTSVPVIERAGGAGVLSVFPNALDGNWNDGRADFANRPSDIAFMRALVDWLGRNAGADRSRVYVTGISNGGSMSLHLACNATGLVAGIAPIATSFKESYIGQCNPSRRLPVVMFNGTADPLVNYEGGRPELSGMLERSGRSTGEIVVPPPETAAFWARHNGCGSPSRRDLPDAARDGTSVTLIAYPCPGPRVALYRINGGGHTWPGGGASGGPIARIAGPTTQDIDAVAVMMRFFGL